MSRVAYVRYDDERDDGPDHGPEPSSTTERALNEQLIGTDQPRPRAWWLGVHGGAGESSLAALFPSFSAAEHQWPVDPSGQTHVVLVARTNHHGMSSVQATMRDWSAHHRHHVLVLGLVLIADRPGRLPRALQDFQRDLEGATPCLWRLPWIDSWSLGMTPSPENSSRREAEALRLGVSAALRTAGKDQHD
jgi:hypothetical protein